MFTEKLETLIGQKQTGLFKTQILIESIAKGEVLESASVMKVGIILNEKVEEDLRIPLFFAGNARRGPVDPEMCTIEGLMKNPKEIQEFDYVLGAEIEIIPKGKKEAYFPLCLVNDKLYEEPEEILVQIGKLPKLRKAFLYGNATKVTEIVPPKTMKSDFRSKNRKI